MKNYRFYFLFTLISLFFSYQVFSYNVQNVIVEYSYPDDNVLKVETGDLYGTKVLKVSFDGNSGQIGFIQIKNSLNDVVEERKEMELIHSPNFSAIDITHYKADVYTVVIIVSGITYTKTIDIK